MEGEGERMWVVGQIEGKGAGAGGWVLVGVLNLKACVSWVCEKEGGWRGSGGDFRGRVLVGGCWWVCLI